MILNSGEYIHIIHRQLFPDDVRRHFVGTVESHEGLLVRVKGYLFAKDPKRNEFVRREQICGTTARGTVLLVSNYSNE